MIDNPIQVITILNIDDLSQRFDKSFTLKEFIFIDYNIVLIVDLFSFTFGNIVFKGEYGVYLIYSLKL